MDDQFAVAIIRVIGIFFIATVVSTVLWIGSVQYMVGVVEYGDATLNKGNQDTMIGVMKVLHYEDEKYLEYTRGYDDALMKMQYSPDQPIGLWLSTHPNGNVARMLFK